MQSFPPLDDRSARAITILLYEEPLATVTEMKRMVDDVYRVCFTDARDGHDHVLLTVGDFIDWIDSVIAGRLMPPAHVVCAACSHIHADRDLSGELFVLCISCQVEIAELDIGGSV